MRTSVASMTRAKIIPSPMNRMIVIGESAKAAVTVPSISAAQVTTRPVRAVPVCTAVSVDAPAACASTIRDIRKIS